MNDSNRPTMSPGSFRPTEVTTSGSLILDSRPRSMQPFLTFGRWSKGAVVPGQPDASPLYRAVTTTDEDARMPEGLPPLTTPELDVIRQWILASAPAFPADLAPPEEANKDSRFRNVEGVEYVLQQILEHQRTLSADERQFARYFSSHHLLSAGATRALIDTQRDAFFKALNYLSREKEIVRPRPVNADVGTIFAVDLRQTGWHKRPFQVIGEGAPSPDSANLYDLVVLEYPYAILYEDSKVFDALVAEYLGPANLIRPVPYVRIDWFCSVVTQPPLYHDLLQLPRELADLERQLGVDAKSNLDQRIAKRAGMAWQLRGRPARYVGRLF